MIPSDKGSEGGAGQSRRDTKSPEVQPALQTLTKGSPQEQHNADGDSHAIKQETTQKAPKDSKAGTSAVRKGGEKDASCSKKQEPEE